MMRTILIGLIGHALIAQILTPILASSASSAAGAALVSSNVQAVGANGGTTSAIDTTGANLIDVCVSHATGTTATLTDSKSNTYTLIRSDVASGEFILDHYYVYNPTVGSGHTFTIATATGVKAVVSSFAFSNMASSPLDKTNGNNDTTNQTSFATGAIVPSMDQEILTACISTWIAPSGTNSYTAPSSFTGLKQVKYVGSTNFAAATSYLNQSTAASINPTYTWVGTGAAEAASVVSYMSLTSPLPSCASCTFVQSTGSSSSNAVSDPTSLVSNVTAGNIVVAIGYHTNWSGSGTTTTSGSGALTGPWYSCKGDGSATFTDVHANSTTGISCHYTMAIATGSGGATIVATDCASNCTTVGGVYLEYSGPSGARTIDAYGSNAAATSGTGSNNATSGSATTTATNDLILAYFAPNIGTTTAGTSPVTFTKRNVLTDTNGTIEDAVWTGSGAINPAVNGSNSVAYGGLTVALR